MKKTILFLMLVTSLLSCSDSEGIDPNVSQPFLEVILPSGNIVTASSQQTETKIRINTNVNCEIIIDEANKWFSAEYVKAEEQDLLILTITENLELET